MSIEGVSAAGKQVLIKTPAIVLSKQLRKTNSQGRIVIFLKLYRITSPSGGYKIVLALV